MCVCMCEATDERQRGRVCETKINRKGNIGLTFGKLVQNPNTENHPFLHNDRIAAVTNLFENAHIENETFP